MRNLLTPKRLDKQSMMRKLRAQRRMATATLVAMGAFTLAMFFVEIERVEALSDISNLFYISGAGLVGAYISVGLDEPKIGGQYVTGTDWSC